ncbi:hypothetical protein NSS71_11165 [Niallia sp. FSL W8-0951]|uniref:hypothetical protein n=1 Tax=Niallia sp. FSL W8-0951 TaxID=2954639 RepID=UPI0030F5B757
MDNRSVNISGGTNKNLNITTGDGESHQTINNYENGKDNEELDVLINKLIEEIKKGPQEEVEDAMENAEKLRTVIENGDQSRAKRIFGWLPSVVQASTAALELIKLINEMNPA